MRNLSAIVGILLGIVGNTRQGRSTGSTIALQLVGDDSTICEGTAQLHADAESGPGEEHHHAFDVIAAPGA